METVYFLGLIKLVVQPVVVLMNGLLNMTTPLLLLTPLALAKTLSVLDL